MSLSSFCVVVNALRLNLFDMRSSGKDIKLAVKKKAPATTASMAAVAATDAVNKTIKITGMMCEHCENAVKNALEAIPGVKEAAVSHTDGSAVVTLKVDVANELLVKAVEGAGYGVTGIESSVYEMPTKIQ